MNFYKHKNIAEYILKFIGIFCLCYYGALAIAGLSVPGKYYSSTVDHYFDFVSLLRGSLLYGAKLFVSLFGFKTYFANEFILRIVDGSGIIMVYSCLGLGVMSFWIAFVFANNQTWRKKLKWIITGLSSLWLINVIRISLLLMSENSNWKIPWFDHHTWFNIAAYLMIGILIYFYDRSSKINSANNTVVSNALNDLKKFNRQIL